MNIYSAASMKRIDSFAINNLGIPSTQLMETAAGKVFAAAENRLGNLAGKKCAVFCGSGNNGGDGVCIARLLLQAGAEVRCLLVGKRDKMTPDCREMETRLISAGGELLDFMVADNCDYVNSCDLIFDAMFGIGLNSPLRSPAAVAVELINKSKAFVVAVDIASGVESDSGNILGSAAAADLTVTFTAPKAGQLIPPGKACCGELKIADIGIPQEAVSRESSLCFTVDVHYVNSLLPRRRDDSHKGDYGKVLMLCGSTGFTGAAYMASQAALRCGTGLVYLGVPETIYPIVAAKVNEAVVFPLPCDDAGRLSLSALDEISSRIEKCHVCLLGPGLGQSHELDSLVCKIILSSKIPLVIDADGINALGRHIDILEKAQCPLVLTPHDGEFARLGGQAKNRLAEATAFSKAHGCVLVLKGHCTITSAPDGQTALNTTGNPGMAVGGSGDVLAGMIASLLGQGLEPFEAAAAGVWLHGKAGDLCAGNIGQYGMLPTDMIEILPRLLP